MLNTVAEKIFRIRIHWGLTPLREDKLSKKFINKWETKKAKEDATLVQTEVESRKNLERVSGK